MAQVAADFEPGAEARAGQFGDHLFERIGVITRSAFQTREPDDA